MDTVTLSSDFHVEIPHAMRESLDLRPGQQLQVLQYVDRIELIPRKAIQQARGFLKGIDTTVPREHDRV
jgi:AbrB family looped-hinge helix DNA binding protein